ncbi:MAG TPA: hypothetical protein VJU61_22855 [Polyangiaceae bacterium]|nr:hypothetical protein [Polyangiaceae bacterium]
MREPIVSEDQFTWVQLDTEAAFRRETRAFDLFADAHTELHGEILNLREGEVFSPAADERSGGILVLTGLHGTMEAQLAERTLRVGPLSQLLVRPGAELHLRALADASVQVLRVPGLPRAEDKPLAGSEAIAPVTEQQLAEALERNAPDELQLMALAVALHEPDAERAFATCARLAEHPDLGVRGNAMLGFGHIARLHRQLDERALPMIEAGLQDPAAWVRGQADSAAGEVQALLGWEIDRLGS